ncbi:MAG: precorrin-4 C(11)-methyltransferase [Planctomycetota bacterium]
MTVHFVGAGPGDPDLLTCKARRLLEAARVCIYAGSLVSPAVLGILPESAETHDSARLSLDEIVELCTDAHGRGLDVIRLHTGDPALYGAIGEQMRRLDAAGIPYDVVPGVSAFQAAAAALACELTAPEVAQTVVLTRTPGRTPMPGGEALETYAATGATLCLYLSTGAVEATAARLIPHCGADCPAAVVYKASWPEEQVLRGTLADIADRVREAGLDRTAVILVGRALAGAEHESKLYHRAFTHGYREGTDA